jgi:hypothetical protein
VVVQRVWPPQGRNACWLIDESAFLTIVLCKRLVWFAHSEQSKLEEK